LNKKGRNVISGASRRENSSLAVQGLRKCEEELNAPYSAAPFIMSSVSGSQM
jgi:hypothetical protein